jgi:hypothetical protein
LSSEKKRQKVEPTNPLLSESESFSPPTLSEKAASKIIEKGDPLSESMEKKLRKGVGYTNGVGTAWNVSEYLKSKEAKSA